MEVVAGQKKRSFISFTNLTKDVPDKKAISQSVGVNFITGQ